MVDERRNRGAVEQNLNIACRLILPLSANIDIAGP